MAAFATIDDPGLYFSATLYVGNQPSSNPITGVGFAPDTIWVKDRDATPNHVLFDSVRGLGVSWYPNKQDVEVTDANGITAFGADGFTVADWSQPNTSGDDYVAWCWKMGTTTGISGSPSTTPTGYSFNQTADQSIIYYIGTSVAGGGPIATLPHGLTKAPEFIIVKNLTAGARDTATYHIVPGNTKRTYLNSNVASNTTSTAWNDTTPGALLFTVGANEAVNELSKYLVAYCFAPVKGYSKFGGYLGNSDNFGPFIYTGFRPAYVMLKCISGASSEWAIFDNKRLGYNWDNNAIYANEAVAEVTIDNIDLLSNGFKIKNTGFTMNQSGDTYMYAAFAESPFVNSNGVPTNAR